ncbi:MAG TPA: hypothetical protein VFG04_07285 [Planctomycetaceae bacterium]|jgi:hypothetical protein|nr:hypothetical protein [Planctomycetaceae bacterium]
MSDEHAKTVDPRPFNWGTPEKITVFFCVNLLAAYVPAVACVMNLRGIVNPALGYLISPILLPWMVTSDTNVAVGWFCLAAFLLLLFWASAALRNSLVAWMAIPSLVFVYSLLQGMLATRILNGLGGG